MRKEATAIPYRPLFVSIAVTFDPQRPCDGEATRSKMEKVCDAALAPFRTARKAAEDADRYLQHVPNHIEELGNEETGDWELGPSLQPRGETETQATTTPKFISSSKTPWTC
jgi:hypothetical protein